MQHEFGEDFRTKVKKGNGEEKKAGDLDAFEEVIKYFTIGEGKEKPLNEKIPNEIRKRIRRIRNGEDEEEESFSILDDFLES